MINLYQDETIIKTVRRHWYIVLLDIFLFLILIILPLIVIAILPQKTLTTRPLLITPHTASFLYAAWVLCIWNITAVIWTINYYLDYILITNRRLVKVEQLGLFARDISEMRLEKIQDIHIAVMGLVPSLLNFGDLEVQTAGEEEQFVLYSIPNPNAIKNLIFEHHDMPPAETAQKSGL
ncbi:MAG: PH domain-containing protein [Patescibacteria group bacterium]|nr:PH domain-containing protein [Patescibacteria group bacterium]MDE2437870.1 PH domain-containing protein [Patescibacteria group bacterium]